MLEVVCAADPVAPAVLRTHDDGRVEVVSAPPLAEFSVALLADPAPNPAIGVDEAGYLHLAGQVVYRPVRFRQALQGDLMLICERVR